MTVGASIVAVAIGGGGGAAGAAASSDMLVEQSVLEVAEKRGRQSVVAIDRRAASHRTLPHVFARAKTSLGHDPAGAEAEQESIFLQTSLSRQ